MIGRRMRSGQKKTPEQLKQQQKYNERHRHEINRDMQRLRQRNPDKYRIPGGVSGKERKQY